MPEPLFRTPAPRPAADAAALRVRRRPGWGALLAALLAAALSIAASAALWTGPGALPMTGSMASPWLRTVLFIVALAGPVALLALIVQQARQDGARRAAATLDRARHRQALVQLLDLLPSAVALCDLQQARIAPNLAMAHLLRLDRSDIGLLPFDWLQALAPEDRPGWQGASDAALRGGHPQTLRCTVQVQGVARAMLAQIAPFHGEAGPEVAVTLTPPDGEAGLAQDTILQLRDLLALAEAEKWHFGQAVHDELGQRLSGMAYFAKALQRKLHKAQRAESEDAGWLTDLANESMGAARGLAHGLLPVGSDDPGALGAALAELCDKAGRTFGITCALRIDPGFDAGGAAKASHLYHAVQELVTNAVKHGQAREVHVNLEVLGDRQRVTVHNNGTGLGAAPARLGMGLTGVRSRAGYLGAHFSLVNEPAGGVLARIDWPAPPPEGQGFGSATAADAAPVSASDPAHQPPPTGPGPT